jgi:hypothetical protein
VGTDEVRTEPAENPTQRNTVISNANRSTSGKKHPHLIIQLAFEIDTHIRLIAKGRAGQRPTYEGTVDTRIAEAAKFGVLDAIERELLASNLDKWSTEPSGDSQDRCRA